MRPPKSLVKGRAMFLMYGGVMTKQDVEIFQMSDLSATDELISILKVIPPWRSRPFKIYGTTHLLVRWRMRAKWWSFVCANDKDQQRVLIPTSDARLRTSNPMRAIDCLQCIARMVDFS